MKLDGTAISLTDFKNLKKGQPYMLNGQGIRIFDHFEENDPNYERAVNTDHRINPRKFMWWLSPSQQIAWLAGREGRVLKPELNVQENVATNETVVVMKKEIQKMANVVRSEDSRVNQALAVVKSDGVDALWRVASKQSVKLVKAPLVAFLSRQTLPAGVVGFLTGLLDTDNGEAVLAYVMGSSMCYLPQFGTDPKFVRLAKECRVLGAEVFLSKVADIMLNPFREQIADLLKAVPLDSVSVPAERAG